MSVPSHIDSARVLAVADLMEATATGFTRHYVANDLVNREFVHLAIARYDGADTGCYLFYTDAYWNTITDTYHDSYDQAVAQAQQEFLGVTFRPITDAVSRRRNALNDLPLCVQEGALVEPNGEVMWRDAEAADALEALAAAGHLVLGLDVRFYLADGSFYEIPWSSFDGDSPLDAKADAIQALARIDELDRPEGTVERRVLITW